MFNHYDRLLAQIGEIIAALWHWFRITILRRDPLLGARGYYCNPNTHRRYNCTVTGTLRQSDTIRVTYEDGGYQRRTLIDRKNFIPHQTRH